MIEKLKEHDVIDPKTDRVIGTIGCDLREIIDKLNEVIDAVNTIQKEREAERFEIQEWIGILEAVRKSVNIHEKQIDELQMKLEPEKCESVENIYTKTCRMDKEFAEEELDRTRKALDVAKTKLNGIHRLYSHTFYHREDWLQVCMEMVDKANTALEQIESITKGNK